jgi:hypothetical protein
MSILWALITAVFNVTSMLWIALMRQLAPAPPRKRCAPDDHRSDGRPDRHLNVAVTRGTLRITPAYPVMKPVEDHLVPDSSFLSQLEQRTQQVKITLANLEAEKVRIESQIARLQPIVPHYDALLEAERAIADAQIALESAPEPAPENPWDAPQQQEQQQNNPPSW